MSKKEVTHGVVLCRDSFHMRITGGDHGAECLMTQGDPRGVRWRCPAKSTYVETVDYWKQQGFREYSQ